MDPFLKAGIKIDKKYVISLDHRQDRKDSAIKEFEKIGVTDYIFYPGFNTRATGLLSRYLTNPGTAGCYMAHQAIIHEAYANKYDNVLIMEDDLGFVEGFADKFVEQWKQVPANYDMVWIGSNEIKSKLSTKVSENLNIPGQVWGAHCYLLSKSGIEKIYKHLNGTLMKNHVDIIMNNTPGLIQFNFNPPLSNQKGMGTDNVMIHTGFVNKAQDQLNRLKNKPKKVF